MAFSFADEDTKGSNQKSANVKAKLASRCKCCKWGSPKFYQLIMNDIPLLFCLPFAYTFGLMDTVNVAVGMALTLLDLIAMIIYLGYDEELSIDASMVYELSSKRLESRETSNERLFKDDLSVLDMDENDGEGSSLDRVGNDSAIVDQDDENLNEREVLLTEGRQSGFNSGTDTVNFEGSGAKPANLIGISKLSSD